jgi:hypothetical protein
MGSAAEPLVGSQIEREECGREQEINGAFDREKREKCVRIFRGKR